MSESADPFIIMCAPNGARRTKKDHPALPITPDELAECASEILAAGASLMHVHVRDGQGGHSLDIKAYRDALSAIRAAVGQGLVLQITTEAVGIYKPQDQYDLVQSLKPEAVSLALREIRPSREYDDQLKSLFHWMREEGVFPQVIIYGPEDLDDFEKLFEDGVFGERRPFILYVVGRYGGSQEENHKAVEAFHHSRHRFMGLWSACCFGRQEAALTPTVARIGGHMRVGFENNIWAQGGGLAKNNAQLVENAREAGLAAGRHPATAVDVRRIFDLC